MTGASTMNSSVLRRLSHSSTSTPANAMPAPEIPPISARELDDGRPQNQVHRLHRLAPARRHTPPTAYDSPFWIVMIFEIVSATPWWKMNKATKLNAAAHSTAILGDSTRVDTTVAIELAASWKPLMTSKI